MSFEHEKKTSLLAPIANQYKLTDEGADRIFENIQKAYLPQGGASPTTTGTASSGTTKLALIVGSACAVLAMGLSMHVTSVSERTREIAPPVTASYAAGTQAPSTAQAPEPVSAVPSMSVDALPNVIVTPPATTTSSRATAKKIPVATATATAPDDADTLEREARYLTDARVALQHGNGNQALAQLDEHARQFPKGWFAADRAAERIVVLCSLDRRDEAVKEAKVFLESRPKSPLTRRVEASCAGQALTKAGK